MQVEVVGRWDGQSKANPSSSIAISISFSHMHSPFYTRSTEYSCLLYLKGFCNTGGLGTQSSLLTFFGVTYHFVILTRFTFINILFVVLLLPHVMIIPVLCLRIKNGVLFESISAVFLILDA